MRDEYTKSLEKFAEMMVADVLAHEGIVLNEDECTLSATVEYMMITNTLGEHYSIYDWIKGTKENFPECFKEV